MLLLFLYLHHIFLLNHINLIIYILFFFLFFHFLDNRDNIMECHNLLLYFLCSLNLSGCLLFGEILIFCFWILILVLEFLLVYLIIFFWHSLLFLYIFLLFVLLKNKLSGVLLLVSVGLF